MVAVWYFIDGKQKRGPVTITQLRTLARNGRLTRESLIQKRGQTQWMRAIELRSLFDEVSIESRTAANDSEWVIDCEDDPSGVGSSLSQQKLWLCFVLMFLGIVTHTDVGVVFHVPFLLLAGLSYVPQFWEVIAKWSPAISQQKNWVRGIMTALAIVAWAACFSDAAALRQVQQRAEQQARRERELKLEDARQIEREKVATAKRDEEQRWKEERLREEERWKEERLNEEERKREELRLAFRAIDVEWQRLPDKFRGHDPKRLNTALWMRHVSKSEFDTEQQHLEKVRQAWKAPLLGDLTVANTIGFKYDWMPRYSAENKRFICWTPTKSEVYGLDPKLHEEHKDTQPAFHSKDGYGQPRIFDLVSIESIELRVTIPWPEHRLEFAMLPDQASQAKTHLKLLLVGALQPPYCESQSIRIEPTLNYRKQKHLSRNVIPFDIQQVWVFRDDTGEILTKFKRGR